MKNDNGKMTVKGPKGELSRVFPAVTTVDIKDGVITVAIKNNDKASRSLWGTVRMHIDNMVNGVSQGFSKQLQIEGIGYRANVEGENLVMQVGFTNPVKIAARKGIKFLVEKNIVTVSGYDLEEVTKTAAEIRRVRPPEPYKGKGIRYVGEKVRKKVGKKAATGAAGGK